MNTNDRISLNVIKAAVAEKYNLAGKEFKSTCKTEAVQFPRQIAMFLACELTSMSLPEIGEAFNRDHTTVMFARDKIRQLSQTDPYFNEVINNLKAKISAKEIVPEEVKVMKVKVFEACLSVSMGDRGGGTLTGIETDINAWLAKNPGIEVVDIRFSYGGAPVQDGPTNYGVMCLILYKDKA